MFKELSALKKELNGKTLKQVDMENLFFLKVISMLVISKMRKSMVLEKKYGNMETFMKVIILMDLEREKEN